MAKIRESLLNRARVSKLGYGIHDNCVIASIDLEDRKRQGIPEKKMIYITFATVDPTTQKKKSEVELSWFKFDHTSDYIFSNIREILVQLHGILTCYMEEDKAFEAMGKVFDTFKFKTLDDIENYKWKKKDLDILINSIKEAFGEAMADFVGLDKQLIRVKITTDNKGEYSNIPKFGKFTEPMTVEKSTLMFSNFELKNHSKSGTVSMSAVGDVTKAL